MKLLFGTLCCSLGCLLFVIQPTDGSSEWEAESRLESTEPHTYNEVLQAPAVEEEEENSRAMDPSLYRALSKFLTQYSAGRYGLASRRSLQQLRGALLGKHLQAKKSKRQGDGVWIWMPAQGYVSVPRHNGEEDMQGGSKVGKVMRYGRRRR